MKQTSVLRWLVFVSENNLTQILIKSVVPPQQSGDYDSVFVFVVIGYYISYELTYGNGWFKIQSDTGL